MIGPFCLLNIQVELCQYCLSPVLFVKCVGFDHRACFSRSLHYGRFLYDDDRIFL
jgi:hypothetical protein